MFILLFLSPSQRKERWENDWLFKLWIVSYFNYDQDIIKLIICDNHWSWTGTGLTDIEHDYFKSLIANQVRYLSILFPFILKYPSISSKNNTSIYSGIQNILQTQAFCHSEKVFRQLLIYNRKQYWHFGKI